MPPNSIQVISGNGASSYICIGKRCPQIKRFVITQRFEAGLGILRDGRWEGETRSTPPANKLLSSPSHPLAECRRGKAGHLFESLREVIFVDKPQLRSDLFSGELALGHLLAGLVHQPC